MEKGNFAKEFIAGNVGGLIGIVAVYPLDTAKIRMQTYPNYKSTLDVIRQMIKADGIGSIYRGIPAPAFGFGLTFAVSFSSYGFCCRQIASNKNINIDKISISDMTLAGALTGVIQTPVRQVVERVKSVMQVRESNGKQIYKWSGDCLVELVKREGIRNGLFQGMSAVLLREVPQFAVYYPCYEITKKFLSSYIDNTTLLQFLSGGIAGTVQWLPPIYFADVMKSRMQTVPKGFYKGPLDCAIKLYQEGGIRIFFRGLTPALARAFPLHALIFVGYETTMKQLRNW